MPRGDSRPQNGLPSDLDLPCMPPERSILERLHEPFPEAVEYCVLAGSPCVLFVDWDYAEDWSGNFVRVIPADTLGEAPRVDAAQFWAAVSRGQGLGS